MAVSIKQSEKPPFSSCMFLMLVFLGPLLKRDVQAVNVSSPLPLSLLFVFYFFFLLFPVPDLFPLFQNDLAGWLSDYSVPGSINSVYIIADASRAVDSTVGLLKHPVSFPITPLVFPKSCYFPLGPFLLKKTTVGRNPIETYRKWYLRHKEWYKKSS